MITTVKYSFYAMLNATIEIDNDDFDLIWECCENHYDYKIKSLVEQGGFLYGSRNKRTIPPLDNNIDLSSRDINLLMKSLEVYYDHPRNDRKYTVSKNLYDIFEELQDKQQEINRQLNS